MSCNVSTGYALNPVPPAPRSGCVTTAPGKLVLFAPDTLTGTVYSPNFTVLPGSAIIIDAYNMVEGFHIYLNRLSITAPCPTTGSSCDPVAMANAFGGPSIIAGQSRMTLGNNPEGWSLYKSADETTTLSRLQMLITIPGTYNLELEDTASQLGMMEVDAQTFSLNGMGCIPAVYHAGVK